MNGLAQTGRSPSAAETADVVAGFFREYGPETFAFFRRRVGDPELAAELNQELYLQALQALRRFRGESSVRTWLFSIAHHRLSHLRARWRTHLDEKHGAVPEQIWRKLASQVGEAPEMALERAERSNALRRCLARLPEIHRAVVIGHYYEGTTLERLTRRLGLANPSGARAPLVAALRRLRRCMERSEIRTARGGGSGGSTS